MPRRTRLYLENTPVHVVQRGNNRQACFFGVEDFQKYLECLQDESRQHGCDVHAYVLMCYRYIELNPVRAAMVKHPGEYPWSSFQHNGLGQGNLFLRHHREYATLSGRFDDRCSAYRALFRNALTEEQVNSVNVALNYKFPLGGSRFRGEIERANRIKWVNPKRGRPSKEVQSNVALGLGE